MFYSRGQTFCVHGQQGPPLLWIYMLRDKRYISLYGGDIKREARNNLGPPSHFFKGFVWNLGLFFFMWLKSGNFLMNFFFNK